MGRITSEVSQAETNIHFSHPHPLKLINRPIPNNTSCEICDSPPCGSIYSCTTCRYFIHEECFEMPQNITHPCHIAHSLSLMKTAYENHDGRFNCDACGKNGVGYSYHCEQCEIDLHRSCAAMPMSVKHAYHSHTMKLIFESPYAPKNFNCDICKLDASKSTLWLYRCNSCRFDAHLDCASAAPPLPILLSRVGSTPQPHQQDFGQQSFKHHRTHSNTFLKPIPNNVGKIYMTTTPQEMNYGRVATRLEMRQQQINNNYSQSSSSGRLLLKGSMEGLKQIMRTVNGDDNGIIGMVINQVAGSNNDGLSGLFE